MRTSRPLLVLLLCSLIPAFLLAQQLTTPPAPAPVASDPQAVALLQKALAALGATVTDVTLTGTARRTAGSDDESGTATLKADDTCDSRIDLNLPSGNWAEVRNHSATPLTDTLPPGVTLTPAAMQAQPVGAESGPDGTVHGMGGQNVLTDPAWFFPALTVGNIVSSPVWMASYIGTETHDGASVVHIEVWRQVPAIANAPEQVTSIIRRYSEMDLFLDSSSSLPVALAFNTHPAKDASVDIATEVRFADYQAFNGVRVPLHVQKYLNNGLALDLQLQNATLNSGLSSSAFQIP